MGEVHGGRVRWSRDDSRHLKGHQRQGIRSATQSFKTALSGAARAWSTFGRLAMVEARAPEDSNLGQICEQKGFEFARLGLHSHFDLSKPQG
eukprot:210210-Pyramimonas_sp.AAC.1